jgi:hypothetical protein
MVNERGTAFPAGLSRTGTEGERPAWGPERRRGPLWPLPRFDGPVDSPEGTTSGEAGRAPSLEDPGRFINRELSWLEFGDRLLDLVVDDRFPLLERVKFLAIFAEGLDEFFQVRVAGLEDQVAAGLRAQSPDGMSPYDQLHAITARAT